MIKKYQVFVSSTYVDLIEERQTILNALIKLNCIPAGMELFPAIDDDQWSYIKKAIDESDYYVLVIGGRYGSLHDDGLSYTEKEFDYAVDTKKKVIALIHENPNHLPRSKTDIDQSIVEKLEAFKKKVSTGRLVKHWNSSAELETNVLIALTLTMNMHPANGWVRYQDKREPEALLNQINELRIENEKLKVELKQAGAIEKVLVENLAELDSKITVTGSYTRYARSYSNQTQRYLINTDVTWAKIIYAIGPFLSSTRFEGDVSEALALHLSNMEKINGYSDFKIDDDCFYTIRIQLIALNIISLTEGGHWQLTPHGLRKTIELRAVRSNNQ